MENVNIVALLVAVIGAGGFGVFFREIVSVITLIRNGVSAKESKRKTDLVTQRNEAIARADVADRNRGRIAEHASELRVLLIGTSQYTRETLPPWPELEQIIAPAAPAAEPKE